MTARPTALFVAFSCLFASRAFAAAELHLQLGHSIGLTALAYSPDGAYLASGAGQSRFRLWELSSGREVRTFDGMADALAFSPDGKRVASTYGRITTIWEPLTGKAVLKVERGGKAIAYSPDGSNLAIANEKVVDIVNSTTGALVRTLSGHQDEVYALAYSPDGRYLVSGGVDHRVIVWEVASGQQFRAFGSHTRTIVSVAVSGDGQWVASASQDKTVAIDEVASAKNLRILSGHVDWTTGVRFTADGKFLVSTGGDKDKTLKVWDPVSGQLLRTIALATNVYVAIAAAPRGDEVAVGMADGNIAIYRASTGKLVRLFANRTDSILAVAYDADGKTLALGRGDGRIKLWDVTAAKELRGIVAGTGKVNAVAFAPNGKTIAAGTGDQFEATAPRAGIWDVATGKPVHSLAGHPAGVLALAFSSDGKQLVTGGWRGIVKVWNAVTGKLIVSPLPKNGAIQALAFAPGGKTLTSCDLSTCDEWNTLSWASRELQMAYAESSSVQLSPDGKYVLHRGSRQPSPGYTFERFEIAAGRQSFFADPLPRPALNVMIALSPDGKTLATDGPDNSVRLFDVALGKEVRILSGGPELARENRLGGKSPKVSVFSPDGKYLAMGSEDGTLRLWRIETGDSVVLLSTREGEWLIYTDDGLFDASPRGGDLVALVDGGHGYGIEQLALEKNRPDLILKRMGLGTPELIEYYHQRYLARLKKAKIAEADLSSALSSLPTATIAQLKADGSEWAVASVTLEDRRGLKSYQVYVNGVPRFEGFGKDASGTKLVVNERIPLTVGENRVEVSVLNTQGQESLRALAIADGPTDQRRDLYYVGFGVSDYQDPAIPDLSYAHSDALALATVFNTLAGYDKKIIKTYTNAEVTKEAIVAAKETLRQAKPQDTVVVFIAGHGLHDTDPLATYYYLTADAKLASLASTAASFEAVEGLLSGLTARQKLFLMDTCESGEREETAEVATLKDAKGRGLAARAIRGLKVVGTAAAPSKRPWLLERDRYIYQDLARRTGAMVFSSSRGNEYSYEKDALGNGLFTYALKHGLSEKEADANRDGTISREELRIFVSRRVTELSDDLQHPTVDRDNPSLSLSFRP